MRERDRERERERELETERDREREREREMTLDITRRNKENECEQASSATNLIIQSTLNTSEYNDLLPHQSVETFFWQGVPPKDEILSGEDHCGATSCCAVHCESQGVGLPG